MSTLDELVPWLREQIAEKRRRAMRTQWTAGGPPATWTYDRVRFRVTTLDHRGNAHGVASRRAGVDTEGQPYDDSMLDVDGEHMELNDPQAAVAECAAHTALVDAYEKQARIVDPTKPFDVGEHSAYATAIRCIALAYKHRPGYREEWRP